MGIIRFAIRQPITVAVGVLLVSLFGLVSLGFVPIQLTPDIDKPRATVLTTWPGASPLEVERELVDEQEEQLKSLDGLIKLESESHDGYGQILMEFAVGTSPETILVRVSNSLEQVPSYPDNVDKPIIFTVDPNASAMAWFVVAALPGSDVEVDKLLDFIDDEIKPAIERVPGVARVSLFGGREREMQVLVDPHRLAVRGVTIRQLADAIAAENRDYSAGDFSEGKRRYVVRTAGDYKSAEEIEDVIIAVVDGAPVYVRDVGRAELGYAKSIAFVRTLGRETLAFNAQRVPGANVLEVMEGVREVVERLDRELMAPRGLRLILAYQETDYIEAAISLVRSNIFVGGGLAIVVLLLFLRSFSGTGVVALSIPISVVATFLVMALSGRTLNVISLAGLAFAVGMVVDNCIVVLENIFRHRQLGKDRREAALDGAVEVWGAVLASTLTTVAVFLPVVFVQDEAGQLFRDIAIAISASVLFSLVTAMTVIPTLSARVLGSGARAAGRLAQVGAGLSRVPGWIAERVRRINASLPRRVAVVAGLTATAVLGSWLLVPEAEYLPTGNSNFVLGILLPPPGYNVEEFEAIAMQVEDELRPYWETEAGSPEALAAPGGGMETFFYVVFGQQVFMACRANDGTRTRELVPVLQGVLSSIPGSFGIATQVSIFQDDLSTGRTVNVDLRGPDLDELIAVGGEMLGRVFATIPGVQARPIPSLDLGSPEVRLRPDRKRMADVGLTNRELGFAVNALVDGVKISDYRLAGREIDLVLKGDETTFDRGHQLDGVPIQTPEGAIVTLGSVTELATVGGPTQVNHQDRQRSVRLAVVPPQTMALEEAMRRIEADVIAPVREAGRLDESISVQLTGTADDLTRTRKALTGNILLALAVTYLLMAALFQSWVYPLVIMFSVPLAGLGGFLGLRTVNLFVHQAMDVLTMLGFVILIGIVVNNAILIVHQSLNLIRAGTPAEDAIPEAVRIRVRPILMSASTSIFGMLPLVLFPGAGSELYRGLGSVVIGGLALSTVFTLFLVPALFSLTMQLRNRLTPDRPQ